MNPLDRIRQIWNTAARRLARFDFPRGLDDAGGLEQARPYQPVLEKLKQNYELSSAQLAPCDRVRAESTIRDLYEQFGLVPPKFVWFESPPQALKAMILWDLVSAVGKIRQASPSGNALFFSEEAIRAAILSNERSSLTGKFRSGIWPDRDHWHWPVRNAISQLIEFPNLVSNYHEAVYRDCLTSLYHTVQASSVIDWWLQDWELLSERFDGVLDRELGEWQSFGEVFWSLHIQEQATLIQYVLRGYDSEMMFGTGDLDVVFWRHCVAICELDVGKNFFAYVDAARSCGWWAPRADICFMVELPVEVFVDDNMQVHRHDEPALRYTDAYAKYFLRGVLVGEDIARGNFDASAIDREPNVEVRRVMVDRFGTSKYLLETGAAVIHRDEFGVLYRKEVRDFEEPIVMVEVVNSTAEPDGSFKTYFLRVPPQMRTAHEAVAWTFDLTTENYKPSVET